MTAYEIRDVGVTLLVELDPFSFGAVPEHETHGFGYGHFSWQTPPAAASASASASAVSVRHGVDVSARSEVVDLEMGCKSLVVWAFCETNESEDFSTQWRGSDHTE